MKNKPDPDNIIEITGDEDVAEESLTLTKLSKDLKEKVSRMNQDEIRFLVDTFYQYQDRRLGTDGQLRALTQGFDTAPENAPKKNDTVLGWLGENEYQLEKQLEAALAFYAKRHDVCLWMQQFQGVGAIISAGFVAHLRIEKAPTAGHFWNFAGLNPEQKWAKGEKRPWNADLKCLCYKLGESFVKAQCYIDPENREDPKTFYSVQFADRKRFEVIRNDQGYFTNTAREIATSGKLSKTTDAWKWVNGCYPAGMSLALQEETARASAEIKAMKLVDPTRAKAMAKESVKERAEWIKARLLEPGQGQPMLPPAHIHAVARRWVVKLFLSHLHEFWYERQYNVKPPAPYSIAILGHAHQIKRPA